MSSRAAQEHDPRTAIAMGRRYRKQTQQQLADALSDSTGDHWSRVMIGHLESGKKALTVETLMEIAEIQGLPYSFYLEGIAGNSPMGGQLSSLLADAA